MYQATEAAAPAADPRAILADRVAVRPPPDYAPAGAHSLAPADEAGEDMLDRAWGVEPQSRLSCQAIVAETGLVIDIPRYSLNQARENT